MKPWRAGLVLTALTLAACGGESASTTSAADTDDEIRNMWYQSGLQPVEPGSYIMDPDLDPSTPLRVVYDIPVDRMISRNSH